MRGVCSPSCTDLPCPDTRPERSVPRSGNVFVPLSHPDPLDEKPQHFRSQFVNGCVPFGLFNESIHIGNLCFQLLQLFLFGWNGGRPTLLLSVVVCGKHTKLLIGHPPQNIVLIEPLEQCGQLIVNPSSFCRRLISRRNSAVFFWVIY